MPDATEQLHRVRFESGMGVRAITAVLVAAALAACTAAPPPPPLTPIAASGRPLDVLPADAGLALVRDDLVATATARFGAKLVSEARGAPTYLIAKRFVGMAPPPPPGAGPDWVAPTPAALLMKTSAGWMAATPNGWRPAKPDAAAEIDQVIADPRFWSEPAYIPPCPDYGASLLLLKVPGKGATVRKSSCTSVAEKAVFAALRAVPDAR